jgi:hypothetical protein
VRERLPDAIELPVDYNQPTSIARDHDLQRRGAFLGT